jgi:hypothetical protein
MSDPLSPERLAAIRARLEAANTIAPGPWWPGIHDADTVFHHHESEILGVAPRVLLKANPNYDLRAVVRLAGNAPSDLAALLAEVDRLRAEVAGYEGKLVLGRKGALVTHTPNVHASPSRMPSPTVRLPLVDVQDPTAERSAWEREK